MDPKNFDIILLLREKAGKARVEEETGNARGMMVQISHKSPDLAGNALRSKGQLDRMDKKLQSMIQISTTLSIIFCASIFAAEICQQSHEVLSSADCRQCAAVWICPGRRSITHLSAPPQGKAHTHADPQL